MALSRPLKDGGEIHLKYTIGVFTNSKFCLLFYLTGIYFYLLIDGLYDFFLAYTFYTRIMSTFLSFILILIKVILFYSLFNPQNSNLLNFWNIIGCWSCTLNLLGKRYVCQTLAVCLIAVLEVRSFLQKL